MATVTDSRRRKERGNGSTKVAASKPQARTTSMGSKQQMPAVKPKTVTQGGTSVNSNTPAMRQIQAKAKAARAQASGGRGGGSAITLPNSRRAGVNLPKVGAQVVKPEPGQISPARMAAAKAKGQQAVQTAQQRRANQAANTARRAALNTKNTTKNLQGLKGAGSAAVLAVATPYAENLGKQSGIALGNLARKAAGLPPLSPTQKAQMMAGKPVEKGYNEKAYAAKQGTTSNYKSKAKPAATKAAPMSAAKSFDNSFASARKAGKSVFTWRGKKYNTKLKGE